MIAKAYRLLHAVLNTAADDELIARNPCRIRGAGESHTPERPVATIAQVLDIAVRVPARFRALILLAAFTSLRYGELAALCRRDIDADAATVTVRSAMVELATGEMVFTGAKGGRLRRANFQRAARWTTTVRAVGLPGFHFHDLRHTGNALAQIQAPASPT